MNPLLVSYNKHYNTRTGNRNLAYLKNIFDCDSISMTVDPSIVKKITLSTLKDFGSIYWHCIAGELVFPVKIAVDFKIPLIIWGAHQGNEQVGMYSHHDMAEMSSRYRLEHDFMGFEPKDFLEGGEELFNKNLYPFNYPSDQEIASVGVRGIFLSNYIAWDTKTQHELMIKDYDYKTLHENRTPDLYNNADSMVYNQIHDFIKYIKFGYTSATDHLVREIRWNRIKRADASKLQSRYILQHPKYLRSMLDWLEIKNKDFFTILDPFVNKEIFRNCPRSKAIYDSLNNDNSIEINKKYIHFEKNHFNKLDYNFSLMEKGYIN